MLDPGFPWASALVALPLFASAVALPRVPLAVARRIALLVTGAVLALSVALPFVLAANPGATLADPLDPLAALGLDPLWQIDELGAWLLPLAALVLSTVVWVTPRTERDPAGLRRVMLSGAVVLAAFSTRHDAALLVLWALSMVPMRAELLAQGPSGIVAARLFARAMGASLGLFAAAIALMRVAGDHAAPRAIAASLLLGAILIRKGIVPFHLWLPPTFERAPIGAALMFNTPQLGAYAAARLLAPHAPAVLLDVVGTAALVTAVYGALLALVQSDTRRALAYLVMSESALVLLGLDCRTQVGLAGGLTVWLSSGLALTGFGMTLAVLEARRGRLSLDRPGGGHADTPLLAACFLVLGLGSAGFPGTLGFVGEELLLDGAVADFPHVGVGLLVCAGCNAITVMRAYLTLFCGARKREGSIPSERRRERLVFPALVVALCASGIVPQPIVASRARAAQAILHLRQSGSTARQKNQTGVPPRLWAGRAPVRTASR